MSRLLPLLPALAHLTGCRSLTTVGAARTLPRGKADLGLLPGGA